MKKIFINGKFLCQQITGVQRFALELIKKMDEINDKSVQFFILVPSDRYLINEIKFTNMRVITIDGKPNYYWEQVKLWRFCKKNRPDELLNMCNISPVMFPGSCVIHDLGCIDAPLGFSKKQRIIYRIINKLNMKRYKKIFTVSNVIKKRIEEYYHVSGVEVIYNSSEHMNKIIEEKPKFFLPNDFFFSLGSMNPNKNFRAIVEMAKDNPNDYFIVSGKPAKSFSKQKLDEMKNVFFSGYLKDEEIKYMYKNCKAFIFPSLYEGFGIPPLEAIESGCRLVICNDIPVLHEIYDDLAIFVDFGNKINLHKIIKDKQITNGNMKYSWSESAEKLIFHLIN